MLSLLVKCSSFLFGCTIGAQQKNSWLPIARETSNSKKIWLLFLYAIANTIFIFLLSWASDSALALIGAMLKQFQQTIDFLFFLWPITIIWILAITGVLSFLYFKKLMHLVFNYASLTIFMYIFFIHLTSVYIENWHHYFLEICMVAIGSLGWLLIVFIISKIQPNFQAITLTTSHAKKLVYACTIACLCITLVIAHKSVIDHVKDFAIDTTLQIYPTATYI